MTAVSPPGLSDSLTPALMRLLFGFQATQIATTLVRLRIDDALGGGSRSVAELAEAVGASGDGLGRLLRAAATLGLVREPARDCFELTELGTGLHANRDLAGFLGGVLYLVHSRLSDAVVSGQPVSCDVLGAPLWEYLSSRPDEQADFHRGMAASARAQTGAIVQTIDLSRFRRIVDVGGGGGKNLSAMLRAAPQANGVLFDQQQVITGAGELFAAEGLNERVELVEGSFLESVPTGGDLYVLKGVVLNWDDEGARLILRRCAEAAPEGATLLLVESVLPESRESSFLDLFMLVALGGRQRTVKEHQALLYDTGWRFDSVHEVPQPLYVGSLMLMEAHRTANI